MENKHIMR